MCTRRSRDTPIRDSDTGVSVPGYVPRDSCTAGSWALATSRITAPRASGAAGPRPGRRRVRASRTVPGDSRSHGDGKLAAPASWPRCSLASTGSAGVLRAASPCCAAV